MRFLDKHINKGRALVSSVILIVASIVISPGFANAQNYDTASGGGLQSTDAISVTLATKISMVDNNVVITPAPEPSLAPNAVLDVYNLIASSAEDVVPPT